MEKGLHFHHNLKFTAMKNSNSYLQSSIDDIIFENRNKAYGAYQLRKDSSRNLKGALLIAVLLTSAFSAYSLTDKKIEAVEEKPIIIVKLDKVDFAPELPKVELPKPPVQEVVHQATQAYTEFIAKEDKLVTDDKAPTIDDLKGKEISDKTTEGPKVDVPIIDQPKVELKPDIKKDEIKIFVDQMPEFNGGYLAMQRWIQKQVRYPSYAKSIGTEGTVYVGFVINTDGTISNVELIRGIGSGCDEEAMRAVESMPKWFPGKQNGVAVRVKTTIPIKFELANN